MMIRTGFSRPFIRQPNQTKQKRMSHAIIGSFITIFFIFTLVNFFQPQCIWAIIMMNLVLIVHGIFHLHSTITHRQTGQPLSTS